MMAWNKDQVLEWKKKLFPLIRNHGSFDFLLAAADLIKHFVSDFQATELVAVNKAGVEPNFIR
jgi:hypothetical protein